VASATTNLLHEYITNFYINDVTKTSNNWIIPMGKFNKP